MAKEEAVAGEGNGMRTRTQVLKLTSKLNEPEIDDFCIANSSLGLALLSKLVRSTCSKSSIAFSNCFHYFRMACHLPTKSTFNIESRIFCVTSSDMVMSAMHSEINYTTFSLLCI